MGPAEPTLRNISDTALWVAVYRARESERSDAVFRDPFAGRLAGTRGAEIAGRLAAGRNQSWPFVARTWLFDRFIREEIDRGADTVLNLAAGLDARPYRMDLPPTLRWIEADLPDLVDYKERILRDDVPRCVLERVRIDLADTDARREFLAGATAGSKHAVVITEGLLIYLTDESNRTFASDLTACTPVQSWLLDLGTPGLLRMLNRQWGGELDRASAPLRFAPAEGVEFWRPLGWKAAEVESVFKTARRLHRLPFILNLFAMLPEPKTPNPRSTWSGICRMVRT